ncbi:MAG: hypothetical protein ACXVJD_13795 [Mucilaginibacter sp.]
MLNNPALQTLSAPVRANELIQDKMDIENPVAFSFIMQEDIYLLNKDKPFYSVPPETKPETVAEPEPEYAAAAPEPVAVPRQPSFTYLGDHKKNFLVIVHYPEHEVMHDKHLVALESTLNRLGFTRGDVAIFNRANYPDDDFGTLSAYFKPKKLLLLGKNSLPGGIGALELNKPVQVNDYPVLLTFSFDEMMDSIENKKAFWEQMKQL